MTFKELRERRGKTVEDLSHKLGIQPKTLRKYESSERTPSTEIILKMPKVYNATEEEILTALGKNILRKKVCYGKKIN